MEVEICKAKMEDTKVLDALLTQLVQDERKYDTSIDPSFVVSNFYKHYIEDKERLILCAKVGEEIVGYLYGYLKKDETLKEKQAVLDALFVLPTYRKQKVATHLFEEFRRWSKNEDAKTIEVSVCASNSQAKKLYQKQGFLPLRETYICEI